MYEPILTTSRLEPMFRDRPGVVGEHRLPAETEGDRGIDRQGAHHTRLTDARAA